MEPVMSDDGSSGLMLIDHQGADDVLGEPGEVAAWVNGTPIFTAEVLERRRPQLAQAQAQMPSAQFRILQERMIQEDLPSHVDEALLVDAVKTQLDGEQLERVEQQLDIYFEQEIARLKEKTGAGTLAELEAQLQMAGTTLASARKAFGRRQLAGQYLQERLQEPTVTRQELLADYRAHLEDYHTPAEVKWQQIWISYRKQGGVSAARQVMERAVAELRSGASFDDVARRYSDGVMAASGGHWDWTQFESIANQDVSEALQRLSVGETSGVVEGEKALQLVRVVDRRAARYTPFEDVQNEIRDRLRAEKRRVAAEEILTELRETAVIETMFDDRVNGNDRQVSPVSATK
ncbi:Foldase protein PrsA precursor [Maioricimonas rarisocia]|uniref:Foldase protein PrsA n=2 Tax=Maioricimonas rarisocia TaxID=2528026 RepID=A0A517ZBE8_9PLAN|nr:Foldase protein PrsA precursor [Maioricimonas rarisocia]